MAELKPNESSQDDALRAYLSSLTHRIISEELANPIGLFRLVEAKEKK